MTNNVMINRYYFTYVIGKHMLCDACIKCCKFEHNIVNVYNSGHHLESGVHSAGC